MTTEAGRILVVDDELGMREGCRKILQAEGFEVETAEDGQAGLELFERQRDFVAAIVDMKMPRLSGIELIESIRKSDEDIALFVITAYATIDTAVEATKRGATSYIPKPFTPDELVIPLRNGLERRALSLEAKRLRAEREHRLLELASERSRARSIIGCMTDGVLVVNRDRQIVLRNAAAARVLAEIGSAALPASVECLTCRPLVDLLDETLLSAGEPAISTREIALDGGTYMVIASPVVEPGGGISGGVAVLRDISALQKLSAAKSTFVSMVAHEIKSPLAAIEGYLNVILSGVAGSDPARDRKMLERCALRARTLRTMVLELISLMAAETGHLSIRRSPTDLNAVAAEVLESFRERAAERRLELEFARAASTPAEVLADCEAIRSVLTNLVDNAVKYTPEGGQVVVALHGDGMYWRCSVRDTGIGLSPTDRERLFTEFFRAKNKYTAQVPGTGLGLSLARRLIELHHGTIAVQTELGRGSTFTVSLPLAD